VGEFIKDRLPDPQSYFDAEDVHLVGLGQWKTGPCHFHGGGDSMRVNVRSGGWICMNCMVKGGDVLDFHMQRHGLDFVEAARQLGAYVDDGKPHRGQMTPKTLPATEAMEVIVEALLTATMVLADGRAGIIPSDHDWHSYLVRVGRIEALVAEYRT
jgi:hypothetical protein